MAPPFLDESDDPDRSRDPVSGGSGLKCPFCDGVLPRDTFDEVKEGDANKRVNGKKKLCEHMDTVAPREPGKLAAIAAKVIMKVFYAARVCRPDLLRAITFLACPMAKWSADCDKRLHRRVCYVRATWHYAQAGWTRSTSRCRKSSLWRGRVGSSGIGRWETRLL